MLIPVDSAVSPGWRQTTIQQPNWLTCTPSLLAAYMGNLKVRQAQINLTICMTFQKLFRIRPYQEHDFLLPCCDAGLLQSKHRDSLWLHLIHYCDTCTAPKTPEYLLSTYHSTYRSLPWKELYPDQTLMNKFFNVREPMISYSSFYHLYGDFSIVHCCHFIPKLLLGTLLIMVMFAYIIVIIVQIQFLFAICYVGGKG